MTKPQDNFSKVTNLDYLTGMSKGNNQFVKEMIGTFLIENPKEIEALDKAIKDKNFEAIRQAAHLLLSSIPFVGLDKIIGNEVFEIERIGKDRSLSRTGGIQAAGNSCLRKIDVLFYKVRESCEMAWRELLRSEYMEPVS